MENNRLSYPPEYEPLSTSQETGSGLRRFLLDLVETVLVALIIFLAVNGLTARMRVESVSMQPTLYAGERVLVNKLAYKLGEIRRGDVIVFKQPLDPGTPYIKRVIGLPGDHVKIQNGQVYVNAIPMNEPYLSGPPNYLGEWLVPQGKLFVLGDNRNDSSDSHTWGMLDITNVIGRAEVVYWPVSEWQVLKFDTAFAAG